MTLDESLSTRRPIRIHPEIVRPVRQDPVAALDPYNRGEDGIKPCGFDVRAKGIYAAVSLSAVAVGLSPDFRPWIADVVERVEPYLTNASIVISGLL